MKIEHPSPAGVVPPPCASRPLKRASGAGVVPFRVDNDDPWLARTSKRSRLGTAALADTPPTAECRAIQRLHATLQHLGNAIHIPPDAVSLQALCADVNSIAAVRDALPGTARAVVERVLAGQASLNARESCELGQSLQEAIADSGLFERVD